MADDKKRKRPCAECPFRRDVLPKVTTEVQPLRLIGQAAGPFWLPCHMEKGYGGPGSCEGVGEIQQCAGAAIFRANTEISEYDERTTTEKLASLMPPQLHALPADHEAVFSSPIELLAAFRRVSIAEATKLLEETTPMFLFKKELADQKVQLLAVTRRNHDASATGERPPTQHNADPAG